ncbi:MAG TPA: hypothetical protein VIV58_18845 [Kofleriaceae bacterium]
MKAAILALAIVLTLVVGALPARATTMRVLPGGDDRIVMSYEDGLRGPAEKLRDAAEDSLARIDADLPGLPRPRTIHIQLVRDAASIAEVAPGGRGAPQYAIGVTYPDLGVVTIAMRRGAQVVDPIETLDHELGHVALGAALGDRAPHWLHEGFAYQHSAEWTMDRAETLAGMVWMGGIIPIEQLDRSFPAEESPAARAYAESYDFVNYLSRRGRWEDTADDGDRWPFRRFLGEIGHGADLDTAAKHQFGKTIHELFDEWREDVRSRYLTAPMGLLGLGVWIVCSILLVLAFFRRRRLNRLRIAQWDLEERLADQRRQAEAEAKRNEPGRVHPVIIPPYVPLTAESPFDEIDDTPPDPKLWN